MAYVISLSNGKGGVAKTTSCIALGSSLAILGYRVLLIDLDPNANLTLGLGTLPTQPISYSKDLFLSSGGQLVKCTKTGYKNLDIIPSNQDIASLDGNSPSNTSSTKQLKLALETIPIMGYDFIVIDCPPSISYLTTNALVASDLLIIPTQSEFFSAYVLQTMFSVIEDIRKVDNPILSYKILVTLLDLRLREHSRILNQLEKHLENSLFKTRIQVDTSFRESHTQGIPITFSMPNSRGAQQYNKLAQEIINGIAKDRNKYQHSSSNASVVVSEFNYNDHAQDYSPSALSYNSKITLESHKPQGNNTNNAAINNNEPEQATDTTNINEKAVASQKNITQSCKFLGGADDSQTAVSYPTTWNKCYRSKPALSPNPNHQASHCLSHNHFSCKMLIDASQQILPAEIRSPLDVSEALHFFKSWLVAKIR